MKLAFWADFRDLTIFAANHLTLRLLPPSYEDKLAAFIGDLERLTKPLLEQKARADDGTTYGQESLMYVCPALISNP